jgi:hypothetical protein
VNGVLSEVGSQQLWRRNIETPQSGSWINNHWIGITGWVLGRSSPAVTVEVVHDGTVLQSAPIYIRRPRIAAAFPRVPGAEGSGFRTAVSVPVMTKRELGVRALLQDQSSVLFSVVQGHCR